MDSIITETTLYPDKFIGGGKMVFLSRRAKIESHTFIGETSVILGPSQIGENSIIDEKVIIGYPIRRKFLSITYKTSNRTLDTLDYVSDGSIIKKGAHIRAFTIIYENAQIGERVETGHHVLIRENTMIGDNTIVGTGTIIDGNAIIGKNVRIESGVYIPPQTKIRDNVFIGPRVTFTNDRYPASRRLVGATIESNVIIGANSTIIAGINIGEGAVIGAGSIVTKDVPPFKVVVGCPAKPVADREEYEEKKKIWEMGTG